ncbi:MAG: acyltransferase [Proteobacteria bacterium]|nr:acyltransferase [Pseudomonadota bacterium]
MKIRQTLKPLWLAIKTILWSWQYLVYFIQKRAEKIIRACRYHYWAARLKNFGRDSHVYGRITVLNPDKVSIGNRVTMNEGVIIIAKAEPIVIADDVRISAGVKIIGTGLNTIVKDGLPRTHISRPITIESNVWLGAGAIITSGVTIGSGATVAAGAVVSKDVAANTLVGGIPAKPLN